MTSTAMLRILALGSLLLCGFVVGPQAYAGAIGPDPCNGVFRSGFEASEATSGNEPALCRRLNDTGITFCGQVLSGNNAVCTGSEPAGQDAHYGRDARAAAGQLSKIGGGNAGFDFTKISNSGQALPASAALGSGPNDWACTRDNVTDLIWEVKVNDSSHFRHMAHGYAWYDPSSPDGNPGSVGSASACANTLGGQPCNTLTFAQAVNAARLCGVDGWRTPTRNELVGIADHGRITPAIDAGYFPNTSSANVFFHFWSSTQTAFDTEQAWCVSGDFGLNKLCTRSRLRRVRLVQSPGASHVLAAHCQNGLPPSNPDTAYFDHGDGTVTDTRSGLMWKRCVEGQSWNGSTCEGSASGHAWAAALALAEATEYAGHDDWRLPNLKELGSLLDECRASPAINTTVFPNTPSLYFISGSPFAGVFVDSSMGVSFARGDDGTIDRRVGAVVRLVRAGH